METSEVLQALFRWFHVVAGILWIGLLYFFNWVNGPFTATMDGETKKKVVPELMPRALFFFRWGAAYTWITGVLLLMIVFYHQGILFSSGNSWTVLAGLLTCVPLLGVFVYDAIAKSVPNMKVVVAVGLALITLLTFLFEKLGGFSYRGFVIHVGATFGTIMAFNVWFRIWPAQQKIITAVKDGQAPDAALVGLAGLRSKHNTYLSIPLVWTMVNAHHPFTQWWSLPLVVAFSWFFTQHIYARAGKVKGF